MTDMPLEQCGISEKEKPYILIHIIFFCAGNIILGIVGNGAKDDPGILPKFNGTGADDVNSPGVFFRPRR